MKLHFLTPPHPKPPPPSPEIQPQIKIRRRPTSQNPRKSLTFKHPLSNSMGLPNQLHDISTDSIPLLLITTIAVSVTHLRSIFHTFLSLLHLDSIPEKIGLSNLVLVSDQLNMNRMFSYRFGESKDDNFGSECVFCLCVLKKGDEARRLGCGHVFHKDCFDGWLDHLNFSCPLCRSTISDQSIDRVIL